MGGRGSKSKHISVDAGVDYRQAPSVDRVGQVKVAGVHVSKETIDFNLHTRNSVVLNKKYGDEIIITNNNSFKVRYQFVPVFPREFGLVFSPSSGVISPLKQKKITCKLFLHEKVNINFKITLNIEGAGTHFINAKIRCETGNFGVDPTSLEIEEEQGRQIPKVLVGLKKAFFEAGGVEQEGVFRLAGEQTEVKAIKQRLNKGDYTMPRDVNTIATLIKVWFRELPTPVLNALPSEKIFYSNDIEDCLASYRTLSEPQATLLDWLLDLLVIVSLNRRCNKMTAQNLAIVVAPNLYESTTPDPMEGLVMSQKAVQFIHNILQFKCSQESFIQQDRRMSTVYAQETGHMVQDFGEAPVAADITVANEEQHISSRRRRYRDRQKHLHHHQQEEQQPEPEPEQPEPEQPEPEPEYQHQEEEQNAEENIEEEPVVPNYDNVDVDV